MNQQPLAISVGDLLTAFATSSSIWLPSVINSRAICAADSLSCRRFPFVHVDLPTFGLREIQGIAFEISEAKFRVGACCRPRGDLQDVAQFREGCLHIVGEETDMVDAESRFMAFDAIVKGMDREIGLTVGAKAIAAALLAAQVT